MEKRNASKSGNLSREERWRILSYQPSLSPWPKHLHPASLEPLDQSGVLRKDMVGNGGHGDGHAVKRWWGF
jgi:hypothetical protein